MEEQFLRFIQENQLASPKDRILLAVSGGLDSMVMLDLYKHQDWHIEIAHCNFQLRGEASKGDEKFVEKIALEIGLPYHIKHFNTAQISTARGQGIQEAARDLRYEWFQEIMQAHNLDLVATAHHADDQVETALMHMVRGSGLTGMAGMLPRRDQLVRPLLFAHRIDLEKYALQNSVTYREDKSNSDIKYRRNFIRHKILPLLQEINPNFNQRMIENMGLWRASNNVLEEHLIACLEKRKRVEGNIVKMQFIPSDSRDLRLQLLHQWLNNLGFSFTQLINILGALEKDRTGTQFHTKDYTGIIDRGEFHLRRNTAPGQSYSIAQTNTEIQIPEGTLSIFQLERSKINLTSAGKNTEYVDAGLLEFPLTLRRWEMGDYFYPLGLAGKQKVKKYFLEKKLSRFEKESVWLLESKNKICWVVGMRLDDRFKVTDRTSQIIELRWNDGEAAQL